MESNTLHTPTVHTETIQVIAYDSQEHKAWNPMDSLISFK